MTQQEAIQKLKNLVIQRGGNVDNYTFSVSVQLLDSRPSGDSRTVTGTTFFCILDINNKAVASGRSIPRLMAELAEHFGVETEPVVAEVEEHNEGDMHCAHPVRDYIGNNLLSCKICGEEFA